MESTDDGRVGCCLTLVHGMMDLYCKVDSKGEVENSESQLNLALEKSISGCCAMNLRRHKTSESQTRQRVFTKARLFRPLMDCQHFPAGHRLKAFFTFSYSTSIWTVSEFLKRLKGKMQDPFWDDYQRTHWIGQTHCELCVNKTTVRAAILTTVTTVVLFNPYKTIQDL